MNSTQAAIYVRKSPDEKNREVSADVKSVALQIENAKTFATQQGWTVTDEHVYQDDQVSGGSFDPDQRPAFFRLLAAAGKTPPPFEAVIVRDQDRWGRDDTGRSVLHLSELAEAGITVWEYVSGQPILVATGEQRLVAHIKSYLAAGERAKAKVRVKEAHAKRARAGWITGSVPYGYTTQDVVGADGKKSHAIRVVVPEKAGVVRKIWTLYADGLGGIKIAKRIDADGIPGPRGGKWSAGGIREILTNEIYCGRLVWPKQQLVDRKGKVGVRVRAEKPIVDLAAPELRIIPPELQARVEARLHQQRGAFIRKVDGKIGGRLAKADYESKYLLSGLARCSLCGGALVADRKTNGTSSATNTYYRCVTAWKGGNKACSNRNAVPAILVESAVISAVAVKVDPALISETVLAALAQAKATAPDTAAQRAVLEKRLVEIGAAKRNYLKFIAAGNHSATVAEGLRDAETEEREVRDRLAALEKLEVAPVGEDYVRGQLHPVAEATMDLLHAWVTNPGRARKALRDLGVRLEVSPAEGLRGSRQVPIRITGSYSGAHFGDRDHLDRFIVISPIGDHDRSGATLGGGG